MTVPTEIHCGFLFSKLSILIVIAHLSCHVSQFNQIVQQIFYFLLNFEFIFVSFNFSNIVCFDEIRLLSFQVENFNSFTIATCIKLNMMKKFGTKMTLQINAKFIWWCVQEAERRTRFRISRHSSWNTVFFLLRCSKKKLTYNFIMCVNVFSQAPFERLDMKSMRMFFKCFIQGVH